MKTKIKLMALVAGFLSVLPMTSAWATTSSTYYAKLTVGISDKSPTGAGTVYAGSSATAAQTSTTTSVEGQGSDATVTLYAYAKANRGFKFANWIAAQDGSGTPLSTDNPYACGIAASASKDDSSKRVSKTVYANFAAASAVKVVFAEPDASNGDGYKYTADDGYDKYKVSDSVVGENGDEYDGFGSVKVTCTATHENAEGKILGWWMKDASGAQTRLSTEESFTQTFDKDVTVWPEFGKREKFFVTCVPAENGSYKVNDVEVTDAERSVEGFDELQAKLVATPAKGYEFHRWYEVDGEGRTTYFADAKSAVDHKFNTGAQVGALFVERKRVEVTFDASASEDLVERACDNAENDFSETDSGFIGYDSAKISLTAKGAAGRQAKWWYKTGNGEKVYFDYSNATTITLSESAVVGVDFIMPDTALAKALMDAQPGDTITLDADADVLDGAEVTIPEGVTVVVPAGKTLFVDGKLTVSGTLTVEGVLSQCAKLLKQSGGGGLTPCNPYGSVKYWKTESATVNASVEGWSGTSATHVTIMRGDGVALHKAYTGTPTLLYCTANPAVAANHVTSIDSTSTITELTDDVSSGMPAGSGLGISPSKSYTFIMLLSDDVKVKGHTRSGQTSLEIKAVIDCAGRNISSTISKFYGEYNVTFINGNTVDVADPNARSTEYKSSTARFVNCKAIGKLGSTKSHAYLGFYDCEISKLTISRTDGDQCLIFCGGKYGFTFQDSYYKQDGNYPTRIYAGGFSPQPNDKYIAAELAASMEFHQHADDDYYYLEPKSDPNVASVDGVGYATFAEAFACLQNHGQAVISMLRDASVDDVLTLPAGKALTIDLNGCRIDAPDGFIANYGNLSIRDSGNRLTVSGVVTAPDECVVENFEGGTADICYGVYQGKFVVNGGTLTTHNGKFTGAIAKNGGTLRLKGGVFSSDVSDLLDEGYLAFPSGGLYYVGRFPKPDLSTVDIANTDIAFRLLAMPEEDIDLYVGKGSASLGACADEDEWRSAAELNAAYRHFEGYYIDILTGSDRPIAANSAKLTVKSGGLSFSQNIEELPANTLTRVLSPRITMTQISYLRFIDDDEDKWNNMEAGFADVNNANRGTTFTLSMDLWKWHERHHTDPKTDQMDSCLTLIRKPYVFGAGANVAMLQAAEGPTPAENFFATLQGAVDAPATTEKTIKLCNDCGEDVTIAKSCTVDLNGFAFTGSFVKGDGVTETVEGTVHTFVATAPALPPVAKIGDVEYTSVSEAISAVKAGQAVVLLADCADDVTIAGWKLDTNGFALTGSVSPADGYMLSQFNGVYSGVLVVAKIGEAKYGSLQSAINAAKYAAKDADGNVTVVLLQDVNEQVVLAPGVIIDKNGFALDNDNVSAAQNYSVDPDGDILRVLVGYEALVDGVVYSTIDEAIEAVKDGGTIKVAKNCTATVKVAHECVVNLAGFVVTGLAADEEKGFRMETADGVCTVTHPYVARVEDVEFESLSEAIDAVVAMGVSDAVEVVLEKDVDEDVVIGAACKFELTGDYEFTGTIVAHTDDKDLSVSRNGMTWTVVAAQTMPLTDTAAVKVSSDVFAAVKEQVEAVKKESGEEVEATDVEVKEAIAVAIDVALKETPQDRIGEGLAKVGTDAVSQLKTIDVEIDKDTDKAKLSTGLYQPTKIVEIEVGEGVTKQVSVLNEDPGVKPDALITTVSKRTSLILAVPGNHVNVGGVSVPVTVANVIASKPSENDTIALWKQVGGETVGYSWSWHGGVWVANKATRKDADGNEVVTDEDSPASDEAGVLAVGMAFRYERLSGKTDPVTVVAQFDETEEVRTTVQEDGWNVVANPNVDQPFDLSEIKPETGAQDAAENLEKDQIVVPIGDVGERVYTYKANEGWGYEASETRKVGTLTIVRKVRKTDNLKVDSGKGFWYFSGGTKPTINWRKKASAQ